MSNYQHVYPCGCAGNAYDLGPKSDWRYELVPCALHGAALELLAALKAISQFWAYGLSQPGEPTAADLTQVERLGEIAVAAIAKAENR